MHIHKLISYAILWLALTPTFAVADPAITGVTGTVSSGESLTISGSSFGTKTTANPVKWDTFEGGSNGSAIDGESPVVGSDWDVYKVSGLGPVYSTAVTRSNSTLSSLHSFTGGNYNCSLELNTTPSQYYFTYWWYYTRTTANWSRNVKPWIVYGSSDLEPLAYAGWGDPTDDDGSIRNAIIDASGICNLPTIWGGHDIDTVEGEWLRLEVWLIQSSNSEANGRYQMWIHDQNSVVDLAMSDTTATTRVSANAWSQLHIGSYNALDTGYGDSKIYVDDVYIDDTPARVEIGDASTWSNCTHREIQVASSWSSTEIVSTVNRGSFASGTTVYLYVIDSSGTPSAGYEITFSGPLPESGNTIQGVSATGVRINQ